MDASNTSGLNGIHLQQQYHGNSFSNFINDLDAYAHDDTASGNDEFTTTYPWDPALFSEPDTSSGFSQQQQQQQQQPSQSTQQTMSANLNQTLTRQSNSPALQQQHPVHTHTQYPPHNYAHSLYEPRNLGQPSFDDRFMSRPTASPASFEHHQSYQHPYAGYGFQQPFARQSSPQTPYYAQRSVQQQQPQQPQPQPQPQQQQQQSILNMNARQPSQITQTPQMDNIQMHQYPNNQRMTHTFVNPSMVNSSHMVAMNGTQQPGNNAQPRQQYQPSPYFQKAGTGSTVDPQVLHAMQMQNYPSMSTTANQMRQQTSSIQQQQAQSQQHISFIHQPDQQGAQVKAAPAKAPKDPNAPKKPRAKSTKVKKDNAGDSDSSDGLEIEDEPPEVKPALLVVSAPTDEKGKALYNAVEAVWYPRNRSPQAEDIRRGIAAFGETVRSLREAWKAQNDSLKKAELPNSGNAANIPRLKEDVAHYRQIMESVISRSLQYGHDAIIKRLGDNPLTLSALYSFLLDRANVMDYDSTLVNSIFKFATKFETLDEEMLEQVKWTKVLQRWTKKAANESRDYAQQILTNAATQSARKKNAKAEGGPGSPSSTNGLKKDLALGVKRPREGDLAGAPAPKKVVKPSSKPLALQSAERRKAQEKEGVVKGATKSDKSTSSTSSSVPSRPKVAMTTLPKTNTFLGLLSASKKPGTTNAEKAAAAAVAKDKTPVPPAAAPLAGLSTTAKKEETKKESPPRTLGPAPSKSQSSLLGFLADMEKPKESETKKVEIDPNETDVQRTKRLRREARRKLRVTWKPDNDLVQVKLFTHDPEEETGQTDSMMRDAGDTMKEGEMLKRHIGMDDMDDMDDDDDDEATLDDLGEYDLPTEVDFSAIDADRAANFVKFGGPVKPESPASDAQAKYEENTLMTTYTFKSDRPDTPKELPSVNDDDEFSPVVDFGEPNTKVRGREREILARKQPQIPQPVASGSDFSAQLRSLGLPQSQPQSQPQPQINTYAPYNQQPVPQAAATQMPAGLDLSKLLAVMQQAKQMQQAPPPPAPTYQAPSSSNIPPNVAAILAQVSGQQTQGLPLGTANNPNPYPGNEDFSRKHARSEESGESSGKKKKKGSDGKPYNYKTITCSFWQEGKCTKGDNCTYKHEM